MNKREIIDYILETPNNTNPVILDHLLECFLKSVKSCTGQKLAPYVYRLNYTNLDYDSAYKYIGNYRYNGACSSYRDGQFYGRNYDWKYDQTVSFLVKCTGAAKYDSIGVAATSHLTEGNFDIAQWNDFFDYVPFLMLDGLNSAGVFCNINIVPTGDKGITTGTNPGAAPLPTLMVIRYILDNAGTALEAISLLQQRNIIGMPGLEVHFMLGDENDTYIIEFINNKLKVIEGNILTNFYMDGFNGERSSLSKFGMGFERFKLLEDQTITSVEMMQELMKTVFYTRAYEATTDPIWQSDFCGVWSDRIITNSTSIVDVMPIVERARLAYANRQRNGELWQTVHTSVYDLDARTLTVICQEDDEQSYSLSIEEESV